MTTSTTQLVRTKVDKIPSSKPNGYHHHPSRDEKREPAAQAIASADPEPPKYSELPEVAPGYRCAWSYFNSLHSGDMHDELGTLNFLNRQAVQKAAREEIRTGQSICLDLPFDFFSNDISAFGGRSAPLHTIHYSPGGGGCEDSLSLNTQTSSQWDGLRHFAIRSTRQFYNGHTVEEFEKSTVLGTHVWSELGGIIGRGVLVDYYEWCRYNEKPVRPNAGTSISLDDIKQVLAHQGTVIRAGDILVIRTGWLQWYKDSAVAARHQELCIEHEPGQHSFIGVQSSQAFVEWVWNNRLAAVAGDAVAFESTPPPAEGGFGWLHEHLLACLGCPMGELWDLEALAEACKARSRYSFFLTSSPLYVPGGVATPANAIAIL